MGRLIDEGELVKVLEERATNEAICGYITAYDITNSIIDEVKEQPTAYDPDKVLDQLWDASFERFGCDTGMGGELVVNMDDVIEIVKAGGNADFLIDRAKSKSGERIPYAGKWN